MGSLVKSAAVVSVTVLTVGAKVSMLMAGVVPAPPLLPAASKYVPEATVMLALPEAKPGVGVKVAVRVKPVPLIAPRLPPVVTMSALVKLGPGSSLKVKVMLAVWPALTALTSLPIVSVGAKVSTA